MANPVCSSRGTNMNIQTCWHEHWIIAVKSPPHLLWPLSSCSSFNKEHALYAGNLRKATSFYGPSALWFFYPLHPLYHVARRLLTTIPTWCSRRMPFIQEDALMQWKIHIVDEISDLPLTFLSGWLGNFTLESGQNNNLKDKFWEMRKYHERMGEKMRF